MRLAAVAVLSLSGLAFAQASGAAAPADGARPGFVRYEGRWRLPQEIEYLKRAAALRAAAAAPAPGKAAPVTAEPARAPKPAAKPARPLVRKTTSTGLLTVRAQHTQLLGFDTVTVGFGTGQGRLMLPRTQTISIGTTVAFPFR